jgi:hypothetical protein
MLSRTRVAMTLATVLWLASCAGAFALGAAMVTQVGIEEALHVLQTSLVGVVFATTGALIALRAPANPIGWLLATTGFALVATFAGYVFGAIRTFEVGVDDPMAMIFSWSASRAFFATFALFALTVLVFPDGTFRSHRWRATAQVVFLVLATGVVLGGIRAGPIAEGLANNPFGIDHPVAQAVAPIADTVAGYAMVMALGLAAIALGVRFRQAQGQARQQHKWLLAAAILIAVFYPLAFIDTSFMSENSAGYTPFDVLFVGTCALLPIAIAIAILRYRLYAIDRLISRTLGWTIVTAMVLAVFVLGLVLLQALLANVTQGQTVAVAASTLLAVILFQPIRRAVQTRVDRRFDRSRFDAERTVARFADQLRDEIDLTHLSTTLVATARDAIRPSTAGLWLRSRTDDSPGQQAR